MLLTWLLCFALDPVPVVQLGELTWGAGNTRWALSSDESFAALAAGSVSLYDLNQGLLLATLPDSNRPGSSIALELSPDGRYLLDARADQHASSARVFDLRANKWMPFYFEMDGMAWAGFDGDDRLITVSARGETICWRISTGQRLGEGRVSEPNYSTGLELALDLRGSRMIMGDIGGRKAQVIWQRVGFGWQKGPALEPMKTPAISADGTLVAGDTEAGVRVWTHAGEVVLTLPLHGRPIFTRDNERLFILDYSTTHVVRLADHKISELQILGAEGKRGALKLRNNVRVLPSHDGSRLLVDDRLIDTTSGESLRELRQPVRVATTAYFSPSADEIHLWAGDELRRIDPTTGRLIAVHEIPIALGSMGGNIIHPAFSRDRRRMATVRNVRLTIVDAEKMGLRMRELPLPGYSTQTVAISPDGSLAVVGGKDAVVAAYDLNQDKQIWSESLRAPELRALKVFPYRTKPRDEGDVRTLRFTADGKHFVALVCGGSLRWYDSRNPSAPAREIAHAPAAACYDYAGLELSPDSKHIAFIDSKKKVVRIDDSQGVTKLILTGHHVGPRAVVFLPDGRLISGDAEGQLLVWDLQTGALLARWVKHAAEIRDLSVNADGTRLLSVSIDGTTKLWNTATGEPLVSFIAVGDEDLITLTPKNFYSASPGGVLGLAFRLGWHAVPFDQFDLHLNKPHEVALALGAPKATRDLLERATNKRLSRVASSLDKLALDALPTVTVRRKTANEREAVLQVNAHDPAGLPLLRLDVFVNGVPLHKTEGIALPLKPIYEGELRIPLGEGINSVRVSAFNTLGHESLRVLEQIRRPRASRPARTRVLAIGVSRYKESAYDLTYAAKDAHDLVAALRERSPLGTLDALELIDADVTLEKLSAARTFLEQAGVDDRVIVFLAGHGLTNEARDTYYFAAHDVDFEAPAERGITYDMLEKLLDGLAARRKLLLMDTCFSGELTAEMPKVVTKDGALKVRAVGKRGLKMTMARASDVDPRTLRDLFADVTFGSGTQVIASAGGAEYALEGAKWKNGVFTFALLKALRESRAWDNNHDGYLSFRELRTSVSRTVGELTAGAQRPTSRRENLYNDFAIVGAR